MGNKVYSTFTNLAVAWISDGADRQGKYPSGSSIDLSYAASETCAWNWQETTRLRSGLYYLQCRACGASAQAQLTGGPSCSVKLQLVSAAPPQ